MKTIKQTKKTVAIFLTYVFMFPMIYSCTQEGVNSNQNQISIKYKKSAIDIYNSINTLNNTLEKSKLNRSNNNYDITQELVDDYATMLGYQEGEISVDLVDEVIVKYADVLDRGFNQVLQEYELTDFTKLSLQDLAEGNWIDNLESNPNYTNLSLSEKELLSVANYYMQILNERSNSTSIQEASGALIGLIIGGFLCNVFCAIGGAIIGGIIGAITAKNQ